MADDGNIADGWANPEADAFSVALVAVVAMRNSPQIGAFNGFAGAKVCYAITRIANPVLAGWVIVTVRCGPVRH